MQPTSTWEFLQGRGCKSTAFRDISVLRYNSLNRHLREVFGERVQKVTVDGGMTCPNRDGTLSSLGCTYCEEGSHYQEVSVKRSSITEQVTLGQEQIRKKRAGIKKFLVYFQAYSGTYADVNRLKELWDEALSLPDVVGFSVATRSDCLSPQILNLLEEYSRRTYVLVELGVQSIHNSSLQRVNRGHDAEKNFLAISELKARGIKNCAHLILYLPGEGQKEILESVRFLSGMGIDGVKLHHLHVLKHTPLYKTYLEGNLYLPTLDEYVETVCDVIETLDKSIIIHRLVGDAPLSRLVAPIWSAKKLEVINRINRVLEERGTVQGSANP